MKSRRSALSSSISTLRLSRRSVALLFILVAKSGFAGNTALIMDSPPGDFVGNQESWYYTAPEASFAATRNSHNGVTIEVHRGAECWHLNFAAPNMVLLTVGTYEHAARYPFEGAPFVIPYDAGLDVSGGEICTSGRGCSTLGGSFVVTELVWDNGAVVSFHASFTQSCERLNPALHGQVFFNSNAALPPPHHIWSPTVAFTTEGQQFRYQITTSRPETLYSAIGLPSGLTLDSSSGVISGRPEEHGQFEVMLTASGQSGNTSAILALSVDPPGRSTGPFTALYVTSDAGDPILNGRDLSGGDGDAIFYGFYGRTPNYRLSLSFRPYSRFSPPFDITNEFYLYLDAPMGTPPPPLLPGTYFDIDPEEIGPGPQVYVTTNNTAANTATGNFTIREISADPNAHLEHLRAFFVQFSNGSSSALRGWAWYKAENVITSRPFAYGSPGSPFEYQIIANNQPTSYSCSGLPPGLSVDSQTGLITGTPSLHGSYDVTVTATGPTATASGDLWFKIAGGQALVNISTRAKIAYGEYSLIGGFIVVGRENKRVIIRAIGPSLSGIGLTDVLNDPLLELHDGSGALIASNDDWRSHQAEVEATGLAPLDDRESAIVATLTPGNYTAVVSGKNNTVGVGLVEVYDISPSMDAHLANVSTRSFVEREDNVMIGGLIVTSGNNAEQRRILLRGMGPSLWDLIESYLEDPVLELHDTNGMTIASNDNWRGSAQEDEIRATGLEPIDDHEAALIVMLSGGNYTAIVRGRNNGTGIALVEAYLLGN